MSYNARPATDTALVAGVGAALAAVVAAGWLVLAPDPPGRSALPPARTLAALNPYLEPVPDGGRGTGVPSPVAVRGDPFRAPVAGAVGAAAGAGPAGGGPGARPVTGPRWRLNGIMVAGDRQLAIINDRIVRPGERLEDGAELLTVGTDHVVIRAPDGQRRRLELER